MLPQLCIVSVQTLVCGNNPEIISHPVSVLITKGYLALTVYKYVSCRILNFIAEDPNVTVTYEYNDDTRVIKTLFLEFSVVVSCTSQ